MNIMTMTHIHWYNLLLLCDWLMIIFGSLILILGSLILILGYLIMIPWSLDHDPLIFYIFPQIFVLDPWILSLDHDPHCWIFNLDTWIFNINFFIFNLDPWSFFVHLCNCGLFTNVTSATYMVSKFCLTLQGKTYMSLTLFTCDIDLFSTVMQCSSYFLQNLTSYRLFCL